jgi:hypothetical protein
MWARMGSGGGGLGGGLGFGSRVWEKGGGEEMMCVCYGLYTLKKLVSDAIWWEWGRRSGAPTLSHVGREYWA